MYEFVCERCCHTVPADGEDTVMPEHTCPECGAEDAWVGPVAAPEPIRRPSDTWPVLTSPLYTYAGRTDRRVNPR